MPATRVKSAVTIPMQELGFRLIFRLIDSEWHSLLVITSGDGYRAEDDGGHYVVLDRFFLVDLDFL